MERATRVIDLSHPVGPPMPTAPRQPEQVYFTRAGEDRELYNLEWTSGCPHTGTHLDAPSHVNLRWPSLDRLDPAVLCGPACVLEIPAQEGKFGITKEDILGWEEEHGTIEAGSAVLFYTGHDWKWELGEEAFAGKGYPYLTVPAAWHLVERQAKYAAVESHCVDREGSEVHRILLGNGILIVENVCRLGDIGSPRCRTVGTFPAVKGASGAWLRLLAVI